MNLRKIKIKDNINLYYNRTQKFKTTSFSIYIHRPITREECTVNALLSMMMRRACPMFPKSKELSRHLDNHYGVAYSTTVRKKGERQLICANFQFINDDFIEEKTNILENVLDLANDAVLGQKNFKEEYLSQEKENLKQQILSVINDKRQYASKRCVELMCEGEAYGISNFGYIEDLDGISKQTITDHYRNVVLKSPVDIFITGDVDIDFVTDKIKKMFESIEIRNTFGALSNKTKNVNEVKNITEQQPVVQGKLSMGFRTNIFANDEQYPAMMMYNAILGCGIFSKLFCNVREKLSLCYYASSSVDYLKGIMMINSGIEVENFQKAYDEILVQMEDIKNGNISDTEMSAAMLGTVNSLNSLSDSPFAIDDYYLGKFIADNIISPKELADKIRKVSKEQIIKIAEGIQLDTVYFLEGSDK